MCPCSTPAGPLHHSQTSGDRKMEMKGIRTYVLDACSLAFHSFRGDVKERGALRDMKQETGA